MDDQPIRGFNPGFVIFEFEGVAIASKSYTMPRVTILAVSAPWRGGGVRINKNREIVKTLKCDLFSTRKCPRNRGEEFSFWKFGLGKE